MTNKIKLQLGDRVVSEYDCYDELGQKCVVLAGTVGTVEKYGRKSRGRYTYVVKFDTGVILTLLAVSKCES